MRQILAAALCAGAVVCAARAQNAYIQTNLVSNLPELHPQILDPLMLDAWGVALRPPGAGGHWWVNNAASGTVTTYIGDTPGVPLYQDSLKFVTIPSSRLYDRWEGTASQPTGQVFTGWSETDFMVSGEGITGASKFVFVSLDGSISGWRDGMTTAVNTVDESLTGAMYTGVAVTEAASGNRLYVCDFGLETMKVFDHEWKPVKVAGDFRAPGVPGPYTPWNVAYMKGMLFVSFARQGDDPGEEDHYPGYGYIATFDLEGRFIRLFEHRLELNAPWGMVIAPADFGGLSGKLLVSNFADGTIVAFDPDTGAHIDYLRTPEGAPVAIDGLWDLKFGNGVRLGYANHVYFSAGPNGEEDGLFGKLEPMVPRAGDMNCDGKVDMLDRAAFFQALRDPAGYAGAHPSCTARNADCNFDGRVDAADVPAFNRLLLKEAGR